MAPGTSSRIFIKNLPSTLSQDDFKTHFSHPTPITDAKLLPQRRIGYVGYKTDEDAAKAVAYFNKSFMGMARLKVELARSVEESESRQTKRDRQYGSEDRAGMDLKPLSNGQTSGSGTLSHPGPRLGMDKERKLDDFLQVMQAPSQSKVWENQDGSNDPQKVPADSSQKNLPEPEADSDIEYQHVSKRARKAKPQSLDTEPMLLIPPNTPLETQDDETEKPKADNESSAQGLGQEPSATSDTEWRRSRTSRLLGLLDEEEMLEANPTDRENRSIMSLDKNATDSEPHVRDEESSPVAEAGPLLNEKPSSAGVEDDVVAIENGRLFIRNLTYTSTSEDLRHHFAAYGYQDLVEIHLPRDTRSGHNKGYAHVQVRDPNIAVNALRDLDQKPFQGRLLHVLPSNDKRTNGLDEFAVSRLPLKKQQEIRRKAEAASSTFNWNSMYMSTDAVVSSVSNRLQVSKSSLLDPTSSSAAVKQALAETHIVQETKQYFKSNGVDLDAFKDSQRGDTAILVKNFPYGTKPEEIKQLFETYGAVSKLLMPPSGTVAIVAFLKAEHAKSAFGALAYRRFKDSLLFLEKAPRNMFDANGVTHTLKDAKTSQIPAGELLHESSPQDLAANTSTLFVRNLNFATTSDILHETFKPLNGFLSARVKTKTDSKKPGQVLSMGFGFLEFRSKRDAANAMSAMDGYNLDGHQLLIRESNKAVDAAEARRREEQAKKMAGRKTKIIIKNLPFEASKSDLRSLFGAYGKLRSVRVPKKFDSSTRGFAFADFITPKEAENALGALRDTHLLGRRLVLEFAAEDAIDPEEEIEKMQGKISKQSDKVALQQLIAGSARQKFNVEGDDQDS